MKKQLVILILLLILPFTGRMGVGALYASGFEVQVPMSAQQTPMLSSQPLATGHFTTTVNSLDEYGCAYAPGQQAGKPHIRRVGRTDHSDDPFMDNVDPIGDTPWVFFILLSLLFIGYKVYKNLRISEKSRTFAPETK